MTSPENLIQIIRTRQMIITGYLNVLILSMLKKIITFFHLSKNIIYLMMLKKDGNI
ncbi:hypothetical protein M2372_000114 [Chryseobacterium sp. BIGb0232]|nr:hypothetical protein [Chryseobacterium sp. BIGb0232]ROS20437.1 hypothetical protein EDF65_1156 [Chryseobacterium nakagawai]